MIPINLLLLNIQLTDLLRTILFATVFCSIADYILLYRLHRPTAILKLFHVHIDCFILLDYTSTVLHTLPYSSKLFYCIVLY